MKTQTNSYRRPGTLGRTGTPSSTNPYAHRIASSGLLLAPKAAVKSNAKNFVLPGLETQVSANRTKNINVVSWSLFDTKKKEPRMKDVEQGYIQNCPLAAIVSALAYTSAGRNLIRNMITETNGANTTTKFVGPGIDGKKKVKGHRYFTVTFPGQSPIEVSDVFVTDEQSPPVLIYMTSPKKVLWPCVLEKAYAKWKGSYDNLGDDPIKVWKEIVGEPKFLDLRVTGSRRVSTRDVIRQANKAKQEPMIAAREGSYHGVVITGAVGRRSLSFYDQYSVKDDRISIDDLRTKDPTLLIYGSVK